MTTTSTFVPGAPTPVATQQTALARIDVDAVTRQTIDANNAALGNYLRTVAPAPAWRNDQVIDAPGPGVSAPHEAHERTARYRLTIIAVCVLATIATAGLSFTGYNLGLIPHVGLAVTVWLGASGIVSIWLVVWLERLDVQYSPEAIGMEHAAAQRYATETDADARAALARAYADSITIAAHADADARRMSATQAQQRIDVDLARLQTATRRTAPPVERPVDDLSGDLFPTCNAPVLEMASPVQPPATVAGVVLSWLLTNIDNGQLTPGQLVRCRVPWSARSELLPAEMKEAVWERLRRVDPPLFVETAGSQFRFGAHSRQTAAACVRHLLSDL